MPLPEFVVLARSCNIFGSAVPVSVAKVGFVTVHAQFAIKPLETQSANPMIKFCKLGIIVMSCSVLSEAI